MEAVVSRGKGKAKIEYALNGSKRLALFEGIGSCILQTTFDDCGSILDQALLKSDGRNMEQVSNGFLAKLGASKVAEGSFSEIKLQRPCPKCGSAPLTRYLDTKLYPLEVPVMPLYVCGSCKAKSYYMTDDYLRRLVQSSRALFSEEELSQLGRDENAFVNELRANIIRIFASKRIMHVK